MADQKVDKAKELKKADKADKKSSSKDSKPGAKPKPPQPPQPRLPGKVGPGIGSDKSEEDVKSKSKIKEPIKELDYKPLEEFLSVMNQWHKFANGEQASAGGTKKDARVFAEIAGKTLSKFLTNNNLSSKVLDMTFVEISTLVLQQVHEESNKAQEAHRQHVQAVGSCDSISGLLRQFIQTFVELYHTLASGNPFYSASNSSTDARIKAAYEQMDEELGWTLEEEAELYRTLPVRGEFPPPDFRLPTFDEIESKLHEYARPAHDKIHTLPALLRRMEGELAFRATAVYIPDVDASALLNKSRSSAGNLRTALSVHSASDLGKIFATDWRAGNLFSATRAAMCFLMHAQTVLDILATIPYFKALVTSTKQFDSSASKPPETRHVLDLLRNIPVASEMQANTTAVDSLALYRKKAAGMNYDEGKTIGDMARALQQRPLLRTQPRTDFVHALIAMFFDAPGRALREEFEQQTRALQLVNTPFFSSSLHFAPLFIHQDAEFLTEYFARNPSSEYSQSFLVSSLKSIKKDEKSAEFADLVNKSRGVILAKAGKDIIPVALTSHKYSTESASLFRRLGEPSQQVAEIVHQLENITPQEKAELLSSLLRQSSGPDVVSNIQSASDSSEYEEKSINYVNRRNVSTGIFEMLRGTLRGIQFYAYPFSYQHAVKAHTEELTERFASLLLGYNRAYSQEERPKDKFFLDLDNVIPFLYHYRHAIIDVGKHKSPVLGLEYEYFKSPLVQYVFKTAQGKTENKDEEDVKKGLDERVLHILGIIKQLYSLWEESKVDTCARNDLNTYIIKILSPTRYDQDQLRELMKLPLQTSEANVTFWNNCERQIQAYLVFLNKFEMVLSDPNVPLPDSIHPDAGTNQEAVDLDDAQVPAEIF